MIAAPVQCDVDGIPKGSHYPDSAGGLKCGEVPEPAQNLYRDREGLYPLGPDEDRRDRRGDCHGDDDQVLRRPLGCAAALTKAGVCDDGHHGEDRIGEKVLAAFVDMKHPQVDLAPFGNAR